MNRNSGTEADLFNKYFPGEPWTIEFVPTVAQSEAMTRMVDGRADSADDRSTLMQMLGLEASTSAAKTTGIGKRARSSSVRAQRHERSKHECPNHHPRATDGALDRRGRPYCLTCRAELGERRRKEASERRVLGRISTSEGQRPDYAPIMTRETIRAQSERVSLLAPKALIK